mmetsp:Transcript_129358/g.295154  ORF Transcript_129358/g.295154 Transcript_129358/m.295154 type:complete len:164 (-) Transcript_129358:311-802(-)
MSSCIESSLSSIGCGPGSELKVTGHSLGAALSGIGMMALHHDGWTIKEGYNFGMPRSGDSTFTKAFDTLFGDRFYRVTHHRDPVVQLPPDALIVDWHFDHVEPEVFFDGDISGGYVSCSVSDDKKCSEQYWDVAVDLLHVKDHLDYMGVKTSGDGCDDGILIV